MKKIFIVLLLVALFTTCFCSCGSSETTPKLIDVNLTNEDYAFGVDKSQPALLETVNALIAEIKEDGTLDEICNKYFSGGTPTPVTSAPLDPSKDQLLVATNAAFEPFEYTEGDQYLGIDMEIAALLAEKLGQELVIQNMNFDAVCLTVGQQKCDIAMAGLTISEDRKEFVNFSDPYYAASQKLIVREEDTTFANCKTTEDVVAILQSLPKDTRIGVQNGTTGQLYVEGDADWGFPGYDVACISYTNGSLAIQDMCNGNIDYVILDAAPATCIVEAMNRFDKKIEIFFEELIEKGGYRTVLVGLQNTVVIAILGLVIGIVIGIFIAAIRVMPKRSLLPRILNSVCSVYVSFFRGTPMVVQLLVFYYVLLPLLGIQIPSVNVAIVVFGLNSGAYISEIMRGGILSVDPGQLEAGRAIGLGYATTMTKIIIPQAVKNILPSLGNEFIALIKETSVVSFVGATDLYLAFNYMATNNYEFMVPYIFMALIYIVMVLLITLLIKLMERSLRKSDRNR